MIEIYLISSFIKLTVDCPSMNTDNNDGWMPILDIAVKAEENQIYYKFYKKPVTNHYVILERSAMPPRVKRSCLVQEGMRRLRNTRRTLPWAEMVMVEVLS